MRVSVAAALTLIALTPAAAAQAVTPAVTAPAVTAAAVRAEASWILDAQLPDGAIAVVPGANRIVPYGANYAALGLARAASDVHDRSYAVAAWRWLAWYQAHQDTAGFVTDYYVTGDTEASTQTFDSTDAYAGTFLIAAAATWQADPHRTRLTALAPGIGRAVAAIEATQTADGLTWAEPDYHEQLLMDNAEVYGGLRAAMTLATALDEPALAARATADARRVAAGVAALWNRVAGGFDWVTSPAGREVPRWTVLYPDTMENAWAVAYGLASPAQAASILSHLDQQQPQWAQPDQTARSVAGDAVTPQPVGYWPLAGWALTLTGHPSAALRAAASISAGSAAEQRTWPYNVGDAGQLIALQSGWPSTAPWATPLPAPGWPPGWLGVTLAAVAAAAILAGTAFVRRRRRPRQAGQVRRLSSWASGRRVSPISPGPT